MTTIRDELVRYINLNYDYVGVSTEFALQELQTFGDSLIPGLIDCLTDDDFDVRKLAVDLLCEIRPLPNEAVPALIERLTDENWVVRAAVLVSIADFGPIAAGAIPFLEPWLVLKPWPGVDHEFLRVVILCAIVALDPDRTELLPDIREALSSDNPMVQERAQEFFGETNTPLPDNEY